jgi:hypothetical protein
MDIPVEIINPSRLIAIGVPALMVLGGILLLLFGYPTELSSAISPGWSMVILGSAVFVSELLLNHYGHR